MSMSTPSVSSPGARIQDACEHTVFASRWLLAPIYLGLPLSIIVLLVKFAQYTIILFSDILGTDLRSTIVEVLSLIDLSLIANLVLIVTLAGYENFISRLEHAGGGDRPSWMGHVDFGDLKVKVMSSLVAITAILVLESFMHVAEMSNRELGWMVGIHLAFVLATLMLARMERLSNAPRD